MQSLASWALIVYGATLIITGSRIMARVRAVYPPLLACPMCVGFWVGVAAHFFAPLTPYVVADGCASSALCWAAHVVLARLGAEKL